MQGAAFGHVAFDPGRVLRGDQLRWRRATTQAQIAAERLLLAMRAGGRDARADRHDVSDGAAGWTFDLIAFESQRMAVPCHCRQTGRYPAATRRHVTDADVKTPSHENSLLFLAGILGRR
jgi:hypothetical protein